MSSATKTAVTVAIAGSAICTVVSLIVVVSLFNEINVMYDETMYDLGEFKDIANDAWNTMMVQRRPAYDSIFRGKRQYDAGASGGGSAAGGSSSSSSSGGDQCGKCAEKAANCPAGPPGPKGAPGTNGEDGTKGEDGKAGTAGSEFASAPTEKGCIKCPAGEPGPVGTGWPARTPGSRWPKRSAGSAPGPVGEKGQDGQRSTPIPGPKGPVGPAGPAPGEDGKAGSNGQAGAPGSDASYCPCPPRTGDAAANEAAVKGKGGYSLRYAARA
ncbi:Col-cuticle-N domain-containing protein [Aphelenchoides fujianensis]|nr:Col-cuticle-N domain-containing protein [Aphelenchoides fujianensis]